MEKGQDLTLDGFMDGLNALAILLDRERIIANIWLMGPHGILGRTYYRDQIVDVDKEWELLPPKHLKQQAHKAAYLVGLPKTWLKDGAVLCGTGDPMPQPVFNHPGLKAMTITPQRLLEMKENTGLLLDRGDIKYLRKLVRKTKP